MRLLCLCVLIGCGQPTTPTTQPGDTTPVGPATTLRVATYNTALSKDDSGALAAAIGEPASSVVHIASVIQTVRPDILLVQEFDYDPAALDAFAALLAADQGGLAIDYPHRLAIVSNTGAPSGVDLDGNGSSTDAEDAFGFGLHEGHFAFALLSRYPIDEAQLRSFQTLRWADVPGANLPEASDGSSWYSDAALDVLRLSSKNHIIAPIQTPDGTLNLLLSHPTPPVFDGDEDRNGRRNHDEIGLLVSMIDDADWLVDDDGTAGGVPTNAPFVVLGDLNADPVEGDSWNNAVGPLLDHPRIHADVARGALVPHPEGREDTHTAQWGLRVDYALPSADLNVSGTGLYWPADGDGRTWVGASDHRMVWADLTLR